MCIRDRLQMVGYGGLTVLSGMMTLGGAVQIGSESKGSELDATLCLLFVAASSLLTFSFYQGFNEARKSLADRKVIKFEY